ncbi:MAG: MmgE/PrpD family protein [Deltaproteobacteria bacterium]|nr:MmgE/PrpD family protein [Deltaproteobacteria bacterium]
MERKLESSMGDYLAHLVVDIGKRPISGEDLTSVRQHMLDALASAFIGCRSNAFETLKELCPPVEGGIPGPAGGAHPRSMPDGALLWAYAINASVFEDGSREGACHPAAAVIPAVISLSSGANWEDIDRAVVAGYEVMVRMARGGNPEFTARGFHPTSIVAPFGAAASAAILSGFDHYRICNALCIAAMASSGLMSSFKAGETQPLQVAWAVRGGVTAALLAGEGHEGYRYILEEGFYPAYLGHAPDPPLGRDFQYGYAIRGSYLKPYPGCRHLHPAIDAFGKIWEENDLVSEDIESVTVWTYRVAVDTEIHDLNSRGDAYFNIPYALSARAILGQCDYHAFDEKNFKNEKIVALMKKIRVRVDPELDERYPEERGAIVEITMKSRGRYTMEVTHPLGEPENPLPLSVTRQKFRSLARDFLAESTMGRIEKILDDPEPGESPGELFASLGENVNDG